MATEEFFWATVDQALVESACKTIVEALDTANLATYYRTRGNYAGATFSNLEPNDPYGITATDLHAVSMLSVNVGPAATRRLLEPGVLREAVLRALARVPIDVKLEEADESQMRRAWALHAALKEALAPHGAQNSNCWVTAAKISARKRPLLIPVRDRVVGDALGPAARKSAEVYWRLIADALNDDHVQDSLKRARRRLETSIATREWGNESGVELGPVVVEVNPLRLIDVAMWMTHAKGKTKALEPAESVNE